MAALAPDHVEPAAQVAEDAVLKTINRSNTTYDDKRIIKLAMGSDGCRGRRASKMDVDY